MSALGHKRTFAVQKGMSALPPKSGHSASDEVGLLVAQRDNSSRSLVKALTLQSVFQST